MSKKFIPLSLKGKKMDGFLQELKSKGVELVLDCRRKNSRSAIWFTLESLFDNLETNGFYYRVVQEFANKNFRKDKKDYLFDVNSDIETMIKFLDQQHFKEVEIIGLICYCPEKEQIKNNCHVSWLSEEFNRLVNE